MIIFDYFKRAISSSEFFWKTRHLNPSDKFNSKYINYVPKTHLINMFENFKINSIIDFGCATGEKACYIARSFEVKYVWCIDINQKALNIANKKLSKSKSITYFHTSLKIDEKEFENFFLFSQLNKIDLIFFSRVLYILPDHKVKKILNLSMKYCNYIYIDDFFHNSNNNFRINKLNYQHTNFDNYLKKKFKCIDACLSPHRKKVLYSIALSKLYKKKM
jgi:SAM-dependent methyltransferase